VHQMVVGGGCACLTIGRGPAAGQTLRRAGGGPVPMLVRGPSHLLTHTDPLPNYDTSTFASPHIQASPDASPHILPRSPPQTPSPTDMHAPTQDTARRVRAPLMMTAYTHGHSHTLPIHGHTGIHTSTDTSLHAQRRKHLDAATRAQNPRPRSVGTVNDRGGIS